MQYDLVETSLGLESKGLRPSLLPSTTHGALDQKKNTLSTVGDAFKKESTGFTKLSIGSTIYKKVKNMIYRVLCSPKS